MCGLPMLTATPEEKPSILIGIFKVSTFLLNWNNLANNVKASPN